MCLGAYTNKGRFCTNSEIDTLISKRVSVENKVKLSQLEIVNEQYCGGGVWVSSWESFALLSIDTRSEISVSTSLLLQNLPLLPTRNYIHMFSLFTLLFVVPNMLFRWPIFLAEWQSASLRCCSFNAACHFRWTFSQRIRGKHISLFLLLTQNSTLYLILQFDSVQHILSYCFLISNPTSSTPERNVNHGVK